MSKLSDQQLFEKAWDEKEKALAVQTTATFRKKFPATSANAARLLVLMGGLAERAYHSLRNTDAFKRAVADYEVARVESAAVMQVLGLIERYLIPLALGGAL